MKLTLSRADSGKLQDAWHYAMLILDRRESTFDGDDEFLPGLRGQVEAYDRLLGVISKMTADNETHELFESGWDSWRVPESSDAMAGNTRYMLNAVNNKAEELGIDARTGERLGGAS